ncbi:MAG: hypothetical protein J7K72_03720 [Candidatus Aenigmarchaeota archaeon]|nr:hypothetical protein [Candidatus Aenigmarchaeota archaeon]
MDKLKIEALKKIQELRDKGISPDFETLEKEGFHRSVLRSMLKEGLIRDNGVFSLTEKGERTLREYIMIESLQNSQNNKIELHILFQRIEKSLKELYQWKKELQQHSPSMRWSYVMWDRSVENELKEAKYLIIKYNTLKPKNFPTISLPYYDNSIKTVEEMVIIITEFIRRLEDAHISLSFLLKPNLSENEKQTIDSLRNELEKMEKTGIDEKIIRNLKEAIEEAENNHYLACSMISARLILFCIDQIDGKTEEDKLDALIKCGIISKGEKSKETSKWFLKAIKSARNAIAHKITEFPQPSEMFSILGDTFKIVKVVHQYLEMEK